MDSNTLWGAIIGGGISAVTSILATNINIKAQSNFVKKQEENQINQLEESIRHSAKLVYLDLTTAILEGFSVIKSVSKEHFGSMPVQLPINPRYADAVAILSKKLSPTELVSINRLYGMINRVQHDIEKKSYTSDLFNDVKLDYVAIEVNVFGESYPEIMSFDIENITIDYLMDKLDKNYLVLRKLKEIAEM